MDLLVDEMFFCKMMNYVFRGTKNGALHHIPSQWWWHYANPVAEMLPFNGPSCFATFNFITSVDRNRSNFQNIMFQKRKIHNFQNNSHAICKTPLSETFRLRQQSFWVSDVLGCGTVLLSKWFLSNIKNQATSNAVSHLKRLDCQRGLKTSKTYTTISLLLTL
jgi:hypothetical protein